MLRCVLSGTAKDYQLIDDGFPDVSSAEACEVRTIIIYHAFDSRSYWH